MDDELKTLFSHSINLIQQLNIVPDEDTNTIDMLISQLLDHLETSSFHDNQPIVKQLVMSVLSRDDAIATAIGKQIDKRVANHQATMTTLKASYDQDQSQLESVAQLHKSLRQVGQLTTDQLSHLRQELQEAKKLEHAIQQGQKDIQTKQKQIRDMLREL